MPNLSDFAAGRNFVVRAGIDIRIHPHGNFCPNVSRGGDFVDHLQLLRRLDIELTDPGLERKGDFFLRLADAGKNNFLRSNAGEKRAPDFSAGNSVGARTRGLEQLQDRDVGTRFHRETNCRLRPGKSASIGIEILAETL